MLTIENLSFAYQKKPVLEALHLKANVGELVCILGANGSGKTTLLSCIAGFLNEYNGDVTVGNKSLKTMNHRDRAKLISYMPQKSDYHMPYKVDEMVLMGRTPHLKGIAMPNANDYERVESILQQFGIAHLQHVDYANLSGGEQQLVRLARGLLQESVIQLYDEPMASLDIKNEMLILEYITRIMRHKDKCIMLTTHNPNHAFYFRDKGVDVKVALMADGKIVAVGAPETVMTTPFLKRVYGIHAEIITYGTQENDRKANLVVPMFLNEEDA